MSFLYLILLGFLVGLVARILLPGRDPMGIIMTTLLGILGSFSGSYIANHFNWAIEGSWQHFAVAVGGSLVLLVAYRFIRNV